MDSTQLFTVKEYQRDFEEKFGVKLHIDWVAMKGMSIRYHRAYNNYYLDPKDILNECVKEYGASLRKIRSRKTRLHCNGNAKERMAVEAYSRRVIDGNVNLKTAAELINRDRTMLYHYAMKYDQNMQGVREEEREQLVLSA
jgi:hypothetical protein